MLEALGGVTVIQAEAWRLSRPSLPRKPVKLIPYYLWANRGAGEMAVWISTEDYAQDVADAMKVLEGKGAELIDDLAGRMEQASQQLDFERAARLRDQINGIKAIHSTQSISRSGSEAPLGRRTRMVSPSVIDSTTASEAPEGGSASGSPEAPATGRAKMTSACS